MPRRRKFHSLGVIVLGVAALATALLWPVQTSPEHVKPRNPWELPDSWHLLCNKTDCSQFPVGYKTAMVGEAFFYFSRYGTDPEHLLRPRAHRYFDVNDDGKLMRSADLDPNRKSITVFDFCCPNLHSRHGIAPPMKAGFHRAKAATYFAPGYQPELPLRSARDLLARPEDFKAFNTPADLAQHGLQSFDDNFWLVRRGRDFGPAKAHVLLISKRPMLFGRHAWVNCGRYCYAATVSFTHDPQPNLPHVFIDKMNDETLDGGRTCHQAGPCLPSASLYEVLPDTLLWVENVLRAFQRRPADESAT